MSFEAPEYTADVDAIGTLRLLEAVRFLGLEKTTRFYQASTSELYGLVQEFPRKKQHPSILGHHMVLQSCTPTGLQLIIAKLMGFMHAMEFYSIMNHHVVVRLS